jgi:hypothetical protein
MPDGIYMNLPVCTWMNQLQQQFFRGGTAHPVHVIWTTGHVCRQVKGTQAHQGGLCRTGEQESDGAVADCPGSHCTGSQARQDITLHPGQDDAQLL